MIGTHPTLLALILTLSGNVVIAQPPEEPLSLWYRQSARQWVEALAVGNGRLGAMILGGTSGIAEMLLQSCAGEIELLLALPKAWPNGSVKGLRARGGFELDIQWKECKLVNVTVRSLAGGSCRLRYGAVM